MTDHVTLPVKNLEKDRNYYDKTLACLGYDCLFSGDFGEFAEQSAALMGPSFEEDPQPPSTRSLNGAGNDGWGEGVGLQYMPTKNIQVQIIYGSLLLKSNIANSSTSGKLKNHIQVCDLSVTYKF